MEDIIEEVMAGNSFIMKQSWGGVKIASETRDFSNLTTPLKTRFLQTHFLSYIFLQTLTFDILYKIC